MLQCIVRAKLTLTPVIVIIPATALYDVVPAPAPTDPLSKVFNPSMAIPRLTACLGGDGASQTRAVQKNKNNIIEPIIVLYLHSTCLLSINIQMCAYI